MAAGCWGHTTSLPGLELPANLGQGTCFHLIPTEMSRAQEPFLIGTVVAGGLGEGKEIPWV